MSKPISDGGTAFPTGNPTHGGHSGMTLRDYFAAHAPAEPDAWFITQDKHPGFNSRHPSAAELEQQHQYYETRLMRWRWAYADAMLAAR